MKLSMNSSVENRKALVSRLSELTGMKPHYDGVPGCTYTIGAYKVLKDGSIETEEGIGDVLKALGAEGFIDLTETEAEQTEGPAAGMDKPEELKLAQGFPKDYVIDHYITGKPVTHKEQVARIGNSVVPVMAKALVAANVPYLKVGERMPNIQYHF